MTIRDDGGPAFPTLKLAQSSEGRLLTYNENAGMSLRDWFAGMAMQATVIASLAYALRPRDPREGIGSGGGGRAGDPGADLARNAYDLADAMLAQRAKKE